jgi:hypothetical protein
MNIKNFSYLAIPVLALGVVGLSSAANNFERGDRIERTPAEMIQHLQDERGLTLEEAEAKVAEKIERKAAYEAFKALEDNITKVSTNTDTGKVVTVTSEDTETIAAILQRHEDHEAKMAERLANNADSEKEQKVTKSVEVLSNGIEMTISAVDPTDTDTIERIQSEDGKHGHKRGGHGKRGGDKGGRGFNS